MNAPVHERAALAGPARSVDRKAMLHQGGSAPATPSSSAAI
jgi:hypothetical protein